MLDLITNPYGVMVTLKELFLSDDSLNLVDLVACRLSDHVFPASCSSSERPACNAEPPEPRTHKPGTPCPLAFN